MIDKTHGLHQVSDKAKPPSGEGAKGSNPPEPCVQIKPLLKRMREGVYNPLPPPGPFEGRGVFGKTAGHLASTRGLKCQLLRGHRLQRRLSEHHPIGFR